MAARDLNMLKRDDTVAPALLQIVDNGDAEHIATVANQIGDGVVAYALDQENAKVERIAAARFYHFFL